MLLLLCLLKLFLIRLRKVFQTLSGQKRYKESLNTQSHLVFDYETFIVGQTRYETTDYQQTKFM